MKQTTEQEKHYPLQAAEGVSDSVTTLLHPHMRTRAHTCTHTGWNRHACFSGLRAPALLTQHRTGTAGAPSHTLAGLPDDAFWSVQPALSTSVVAVQIASTN